VEGAAVQEPSFTDIEVLATLLQHVDCVVTNAGTILLDALVNDRPVVCVLYDEGDDGPPGESWAAKSVIGEHYRDVAVSGAFHSAASFDEVASGIQRSLAQPAELDAERRAVVATVVGSLDGRSAERVVDAILDGIGG
jgi:CDP-glycerol glycerophosphotransferase (TagB/SpsB family)